MHHQNQKAISERFRSVPKKPLLMATLAFVSVFGIAASKASDWTPSSTIGRIFNGRPAHSASDTLDRVGGLLKSGPLRRMKESGSYATLLERPALIRIKLVDGQLAVVIVPGEVCPAP
jgi:hypothetical protein